MTEKLSFEVTIKKKEEKMSKVVLKKNQSTIFFNV